MSLGSQQARLLVDSLVGKAAVFRLGDRRSNLELAKTILPTMAASREGCVVLDLDAFYSSNMDAIAVRIPGDRLERIGLAVPEPGLNIESALTELFTTSDRPLIIDSANSLYQLLSWQSQRSAGRKFAFLVAALSNWAHVNEMPVLSSIYERETPARKKTPRSLSEMFDVVISVAPRADGLMLTCERGNAWRDRTLFLPLKGGQVRAHED